MILIVQVIILHKRINALTRGKNAQSLETTINTMIADMKQLEIVHEQHNQQLTTLESKAARAVQGVATIRFNPFKNAGGNQSFATAFINEHGDGVIISTLYGRERVSMFAKPITHWKSEFELTPEEGIALSQAKTYQS